MSTRKYHIVVVDLECVYSSAHPSQCQAHLKNAKPHLQSRLNLRKKFNIVLPTIFREVYIRTALYFEFSDFTNIFKRIFANI